MEFQNKNWWALILGGSSGFGLATAKKLSSLGVNICVVHRDRKGSMDKIEQEFEEIRKTGVKFIALNTNALTDEGRAEVLDTLSKQLAGGKIRLLLHSIAFGNLKLLAPMKSNDSSRIQNARKLLADKLGVSADDLASAVNSLFKEGNDAMMTLADAPDYNNEAFAEDEDVANTIYFMGTNLLTWTQDVFQRKLFADDARVLGLTSEGNEVAWRGYAAVSAAKVAMEAVSRSIAVEFAPYGIRSNIIQAGVTDTPALRLIPGSSHMSANTRLRNPFGRLTRTQDVANFISLMIRDESSWVNGVILRVDGGERISG